MRQMKEKAIRVLAVVKKAGMEKEEGIDGILVTVGLCIIALLLCVVMKDSLATFVKTIVTELTKQAKSILAGTYIFGGMF